jgi:hypothetical protein
LEVGVGKDSELFNMLDLDEEKLPGLGDYFLNLPSNHTSGAFTSF